MTPEEQLVYLKTGYHPNEHPRTRRPNQYRRRYGENWGHLIEEIKNPSLEAQLFAVQQNSRYYTMIKNPHIQVTALLIKKHGKAILNGNAPPDYLPTNVIKILIRKSRSPIGLLALMYYPEAEQPQFLSRFAAWLESKRENKSLSFMSSTESNINKIKHRRRGLLRIYKLAEPVRVVLLKWLIKRGAKINKSAYDAIFADLSPKEKELLEVLKSPKAIAAYHQQHPDLAETWDRG